MKKSVTRGKGPEPLSKARILQAALAMADEEGITSLTMRKLGERLGVEAMSLYNHVANKEELINGLVDKVTREIPVPDDREEWKTAMRQRAHAARQTYLRHPWAISLSASHKAQSFAKMKYHNAILRCFRKAGFSVALALHSHSLLDTYITGAVTQELNLPFNTAQESTEVAKTEILPMLSAEFPYLMELITQVIMKSGYDFADEFEFGLNLILDGLEKALKAEHAEV